MAELREIDKLAKRYERLLETPFKYAAAYSGGELCPVKIDIHNQFEAAEDGGYINMAHNYGWVACSLNHAEAGYEPPSAKVKRIDTDNTDRERDDDVSGL
jgi:hypothetical protein